MYSYGDSHADKIRRLVASFSDLYRCTGVSQALRRPLPHLLPDEGHDADPGEHVLPAEALARHPVGERFGVVGARLAQVTHEQRHVGAEVALRLAAQVPYQPGEERYWCVQDNVPPDSDTRWMLVRVAALSELFTVTVFSKFEPWQ